VLVPGVPVPVLSKEDFVERQRDRDRQAGEDLANAHWLGLRALLIHGAHASGSALCRLYVRLIAALAADPGVSADGAAGALRFRG
jgi:hypothetical protein